MAEKRYMISDASKQVDVEAHVLRYWEEELCLDIPRNEMGHRYYTEENITLLKNIKLLKDQGFQLKAIKMILPDLIRSGGSNLDAVLVLKDELNNKVMEEERSLALESSGQSTVPTQVAVRQTTSTDPSPSVSNTSEQSSIHISDKKIQQFQAIMSKIITQALAESSTLIGQNVSDCVSDTLIKEMDCLIRSQNDKNEERFKRLDETIRSYQKSRLESASSLDEPRNEPRRKKRKFFRKR